MILEEFLKLRWAVFRKWFHENMNSELIQFFRHNFYEDISKTNKIIAFVPWFMSKHVYNYVSVLERDYTLTSGKIVNSIFPPQQSFQIGDKDKIVYCTAFSNIFENDVAAITAKNLNTMLTQNNYTNMYVSILGEQVIKIHEKLDKLIAEVQKIQQKDTKGKEQIATTSIQPPLEVKDFKLKSLDDIEELLNKKFGEFRANPLSLEHTSPNNLKVNDEINKISEKYARKPYQKMFYYPRPTPQDVLIEEQDNDHYHQGYSGSDIYEWNIDGLAEKQIYTTVHRMLMYSTICKVNKNTDRAIAEMIIAGFTGQLKGWWDNYLTHDQRFQKGHLPKNIRTNCI